MRKIDVFRSYGTRILWSHDTGAVASLLGVEDGNAETRPETTPVEISPEV